MVCKKCGVKLEGSPKECPVCGAFLGMPKKAKAMLCLFFGMFLLIGLLAAFTGVSEMIESKRNSPYYVTVEGEITSITSRRVRKAGKRNEYRTEYTVLVEYTYDGEEYENVELNRYSSGMDEGEKVEVTIDSREPDTSVDPNGWILQLVMSIPFILIGGFFLFKVLC